MDGWINVIAPILTTFIGVILGYYFKRLADKKKIDESKKKEMEAQEKLKHQKQLTFYRMMSMHLHASHDAFKDQCRIRNRLLQMLGYDLMTFDWEKLEEMLVKAYSNLNDEQQNLFDFIRSITENSLFRRNQEMLTLLCENSDYFHTIPDFKELQSHLELWIDKFEAVWKKRDDYCLIYVGVKENKRFPPGIDKKVDQVISEMEGSI